MFRITETKNGRLILEVHGVAIESVSDHTGTTVFIPVDDLTLTELEHLLWSYFINKGLQAHG